MTDMCQGIASNLGHMSMLESSADQRSEDKSTVSGPGAWPWQKAGSCQQGSGVKSCNARRRYRAPWKLASTGHAALILPRVLRNPLGVCAPRDAIGHAS
jgi:hypothetical protein